MKDRGAPLLRTIKLFFRRFIVVAAFVLRNQRLTVIHYADDGARLYLRLLWLELPYFRRSLEPGPERGVVDRLLYCGRWAIAQK